MSLPPTLVQRVRQSRTLHLCVDNPGWDDYRGYLVENDALVLYFPVAKKWMPADTGAMQVLIPGPPRLLLRGTLLDARSDMDGSRQLMLALEQGLEEEKARYMIFDKRTGKPRSTRRKLIVERIEELDVN